MRSLPALLFPFLLIAPAQADDWTLIPVPGTWESIEKFAKHDGFAWYRCSVDVPDAWKDEDTTAVFDNVDNAHEVFLNGSRVGGGGAFPPNYRNGLAERGRYRLDARTIQPGKRNTIAVRIYDHDGRGGFKGAAPMLVAARDAIVLKGDWQFRTGDDLAWARADDLPADSATFRKLTPITDLQQTGSRDSTGPLPPAEALKKLKTPDDLEVEQVLAEPLVAQPVFLTFDERGRMWVVQYRQYPHPAGLKMVARDQYWRAVYDKIPLPPPHGVKGRDKITIHEDTDGDGKFDNHKTFVDGLNIATACVPGKGGVWVLNPPYLLFYPDANRDDVPDADPVVHLEGFGLEDTHSVVNSLCWGPDGWLYAAQGSTVSGDVRRPGEKTGVKSQGQLIWRYHPEKKTYEIFAEGGGNAFGVCIDSKGRIFSGHNGGDTRGFHYQQGAYLQKGFSKHGALSNPYAFGYFPPMAHHSVPRFTHTFVIYDGAALPEKYRGLLFGVAPLLNHVVMSEVISEGSTFRTKDVGLAIDGVDDPWFRPVDIKLGPDGALYVADWYDGQANHYRNHEGQIDTTNGRIYRLKARGAKPSKPVDLSRKTVAELVEIVARPERVKFPEVANVWHRQTALHLLEQAGPRDELLPKGAIREASDADYSLWDLWAQNAIGEFPLTQSSELLRHRDPFVRLWMVRLLGDSGGVAPAREQPILAPELAKALERLARDETNVEVRAQLASTAKRLLVNEALPILRGLWSHAEDLKDPRVPLLTWWALEHFCTTDREAVLKLFDDSTVWTLPLVPDTILPRLMRRLAASGTRRDLLQAAQLLQRAPAPELAAKLIKGFEEAYQGRPMGALPDELLTALAKQGGGSALLGVRLGKPEALAKALQTVANSKADRVKRIEFAQVLGDVRPKESLPVLIASLKSASQVQPADSEFLAALLTALSGWSESSIAGEILFVLAKLPPDAQSLALAVLASRPRWTLELLQAVDRGQIAPGAIPADLVRRMTVHKGDAIHGLIKKHWGSVAGATTAEMQQEIARLKQLVADNPGSPYAGKKVFLEVCGKCHRLHGQGGQIGPDLTTYKRDDVDTMLLNIVNPSAEIREGFETWLAADTSGRVITGFLVDQDPKAVTLRGAEGQTLTLARDSLDEFVRLKTSLMPEGLLKQFTPQQTRDLMAYLRTSQPLND